MDDSFLSLAVASLCKSLDEHYEHSGVELRRAREMRVDTVSPKESSLLVHFFQTPVPVNL